MANSVQSLIALMGHRTYRVYTIGNVISLIGTWMHKVTVGWLTWQLTGSGSWLGLMAFADLAPAILVGPFAGAVADRWNIVKLLKVTQALGGLAINYRESDFVEVAKGWSGGIDVALDNAGAEVLVATYRAMAPYGRVATLMGMPADDAGMTAYNMNLSVHNLMMLTPMWLGLTDRLAAQAGIVRQALELVARGDLRVRLAGEFPLAEARAAQAFLESGQAVGKVVLRIAS